MHLTIRYFPFLISLAQLLVLSNGQQIVVNRILDGFRWSNPFHSGEGGVTTPAGFRATCEVAAMFRARQHSVHDVNSPPPLGLAPWADAIKYFFGGRPFPGSWEGLDPQDVMDRDIVMMEYKDVPAAVRDWLREQKKDAESEGRWLFAVYGKPKETGPGDEEKVLRQADLDEGPDEDKVILFAPGAIYEILPLWVADGSDCSGKSSWPLSHRSAF